MRRIRSLSGGWVANIALKPEVARPKNMWLACGAFGFLTAEPVTKPPIFLSAPAIPEGCRVNCTAEASARNSRCRLTAALIRLPKNVPAKPMTASPAPIARTGRAPLLSLDRPPPVKNDILRTK